MLNVSSYYVTIVTVLNYGDRLLRTKLYSARALLNDNLLIDDMTVYCKVIAPIYQPCIIRSGHNAPCMTFDPQVRLCFAHPNNYCISKINDSTVRNNTLTVAKCAMC